MENSIQSFTNTEFGELEILQEGDKFWFPATKCARILGYTNPEKAVRDHCKGVNETFTPSHGGMQKTRFIPEGDVYRLIIRSKLESAERFERWVFEDVLPSIRKHGAYISPELLEELQRNTEKNAELLATLAAEQRNRIRLEDENRKLSETARTLQATVKVTQPKAAYYDLILENPDAVPITLIAKDYGYSAVKFNALLHEYGIQFAVGGTWELYQAYADCGYTHNNVHYTKTGRNKVHMCWTQKGRLFLYEYLRKEGILPMIEQPRQEVMA